MEKLTLQLTKQQVYNLHQLLVSVVHRADCDEPWHKVVSDDESKDAFAVLSEINKQIYLTKNKAR